MKNKDESQTHSTLESKRVFGVALGQERDEGAQLPARELHHAPLVRGEALAGSGCSQGPNCDRAGTPSFLRAFSQATQNNS